MSALEQTRLERDHASAALNLGTLNARRLRCAIPNDLPEATPQDLAVLLRQMWSICAHLSDIDRALRLHTPSAFEGSSPAPIALLLESLNEAHSRARRVISDRPEAQPTNPQAVRLARRLASLTEEANDATVQLITRVPPRSETIDVSLETLTGTARDFAGELRGALQALLDNLGLIRSRRSGVYSHLGYPVEAATSALRQIAASYDQAVQRVADRVQEVTP